MYGNSRPPPPPQVRFHTNLDHHPSPPTIVRTIWIPQADITTICGCTGAIACHNSGEKEEVSYFYSASIRIATELQLRTYSTPSVPDESKVQP